MLNPKLPKYMDQDEVKKFFDQVKDKRDRTIFVEIEGNFERLGKDSAAQKRYNFLCHSFGRHRED